MVLVETFNDFCFNWELSDKFVPNFDFHQFLRGALKKSRDALPFFKKWTNLQVCCQAPSFETNISCHDAKRVEAFRGLNSKHFRNGKMGHKKNIFQWWISMLIFFPPPTSSMSQIRRSWKAFTRHCCLESPSSRDLPPVTCLSIIPTPSCIWLFFADFLPYGTVLAMVFPGGHGAGEGTQHRFFVKPAGAGVSHSSQRSGCMAWRVSQFLPDMYIPKASQGQIARKQGKHTKAHTGRAPLLSEGNSHQVSIENIFLLSSPHTFGRTRNAVIPQQQNKPRNGKKHAKIKAITIVSS